MYNTRIKDIVATMLIMLSGGIQVVKFCVLCAYFNDKLIKTIKQIN